MAAMPSYAEIAVDRVPMTGRLHCFATSDRVLLRLLEAGGEHFYVHGQARGGRLF
jgi:hypothetical protein